MPSKIPTHKANTRGKAQPSFQPEQPRRLSPSKRGYNRSWQARRLQVLARSPLCQHCLLNNITREATEVDHNTPIAQGGDNSDANLTPLCKPCHSRKTASQDRPNPLILKVHRANAETTDAAARAAGRPRESR